jgi:hypothetical protein
VCALAIAPDDVVKSFPERSQFERQLHGKPCDAAANSSRYSPAISFIFRI